jgi:4-amino-4-deoxy-L-arabinose transferase-like glycosyltransferase
MQESSLDERLPFGNRHFFMLSVLALMILFVNLHVGDLSGYDDAYHAEEGRTMLDSGDYWTVRHNGTYNPEFPPLFYWIEALSMKALGANDFAAKFPVALFGAATIMVTYFIAYELTGQIWLALISLAVMMTSQYFMKYATHAMTDVPYTFFFALSILFYFKAFRQPRFFALSGLAVGLALLTRPYVGIMLFAIFLTHVLWNRRKDLLWSAYVLSGLGLALLLPAIWYFVQYRLHGALGVSGPAALISVQMASGKAPDFMKILQGSTKYLTQLLKLYWPWLPFMIIGLATQSRKAFRERDLTATLLLAWIAWVFIPFSLSSAKQLRYIMAIFPAFAILAAMPIYRWIPAQRRKMCFYGFYILGFAGVVFMHFFPGNLMRAADMRKLAPAVAANSRPDQRVVLYTNGWRQWNYQSQLIWYANRNTEFHTNFETVLRRMTDNPKLPVVMDKDSFRQFEHLAKSEFRLNILSESEHFLCFNAIPSKNAADSFHFSEHGISLLPACALNSQTQIKAKYNWLKDFNEKIGPCAALA